MVIYLDWQIFQYIKSPRPNNFYDKILGFIIQNRIRDTIFPYSNAHLNDLYNSYKKAGEITNYIQEDLELIRNYCDSILLQKEYKTDEVKLIKYDPEIYFQQIIEDKKEDLLNLDTFDRIFDDIPGGSEYREMFNKILNQEIPNANIGEIPEDYIKDNPLLEVFKKTSFTLRDFFTHFSNFYEKMNSEHEFYKKLRDHASQIKDIYEFIGSSDTEIFHENIELMYKYHNKKIDEEDFYTQYTTAYSLLDITGIKSEKITPKNYFPNITNDSIHSFYGLYTDFYITEDNANYEKSKFLSEYFHKKNKPVKLNEFIDLIEYKTGDA